MNQQPAFCRNCGQPLSPGTAFCINCGAAVSAQSPVPTDDAPQPNTAYAPQPMPYAPQPAAYPAPTSYPAPKPKKRPAVGVILVGLLLILVGLRGPTALLFGKSATARIDSVRQVIDSTADRMDYKYRISYSFAAADGKSHSGSYDLNKVYNVATLPGTGSLLTVKYIPGLAFINTPASQGSPGLAMLLLCGLGVLLIVLGAKGTVNLRLGQH
jgi:hypothetical protein